MDHTQFTLENSGMSRLLEKTEYRRIRKGTLAGIYDRLWDYLTKIRLHTDDPKPWVQIGTENVQYHDILTRFATLTEYEMAAQSFPLDAAEIHGAYCSLVLYLINGTRGYLEQKYPQHSFFIGIYAEKKRRWSLRLQVGLFRSEEFSAGWKIERAPQPTLFRVLQPMTQELPWREKDEKIRMS